MLISAERQDTHDTLAHISALGVSEVLSVPGIY